MSYDGIAADGGNRSAPGRSPGKADKKRKPGTPPQPSEGNGETPPQPTRSPGKVSKESKAGARPQPRRAQATISRQF